ncbi:MAG TPA: hypothetical protein VFS83_01340 [Ktedonobacterales bacterium]|nr:hypothetical protein [Ktedonobacterales bacterium]
MSNAEQGEQVNRALGELVSALIENLVIDVQHKRVTFDAHSHWSDGEHRYSVAFEGVASFYVVLGAKEGRFAPPRADRFPGDTAVAECDDASYLPEKVDGVRFRAVPGTFVSTWAADFDTHPNFLISLGDQILLLEARLVRINDETFEVGYVSDLPVVGQ